MYKPSGWKLYRVKIPLGMLMSNIEALEGRVLLSGSAVRPGSLDTTFGSGGVVTGTSASVGGQSLVVQSDGKVLVATTTSSAGLDSFGVTRYDANGTPDTSFGTNGTVVVNVDGENDQAAAIALQSNGQIIVAGSDVPSMTRLEVIF
jgi:uncharacterized delta-60 repeat protein